MEELAGGGGGGSYDLSSHAGPSRSGDINSNPYFGGGAPWNIYQGGESSGPSTALLVAALIAGFVAWRFVRA